jgi:uncharacterized membrane protein
MRDERTRTVINALTVVCLVVAVGGAIHPPPTSGTHDPETELYLLTENEGGDLEASGYPRSLPTNDSTRSVFVGVRNHLPSPTEYVLRVQLQSVSFGEETLTVERRTEVASQRLTVDGNGQTTTPVELSAPPDTNASRIVFLLYRSDPPTNATTDSAHRHVHYWLNETRGQ